jgi:2-oxoglutarate ferredoxin oxidoreductase subunit alpha
MQRTSVDATMAKCRDLIVNVMRGGPSKGSADHAAQADVMHPRWGTMLIIRSSHRPYSVGETFDLSIGRSTGRKFRTPVILLMDEILGHVNERLFFRDLRNSGGQRNRRVLHRRTICPMQY